MSEQKHTPTPWYWGDGWATLHPGSEEDEFDGDKYADLQLFGANGEEIIPIRVDHYHPEWDVDLVRDPLPDRTDREFMLRAVNAHEELVRAAGALLEEITSVNERNRRPLPIDRGIVQRLRRALAKAEGAPDAT